MDPYNDDKNNTYNSLYFRGRTLQENLSHKLRELEQEKIALQSLNDYMSNQTITPDELADYYCNMMNYLLPMRAYLDMLLSGHFGELNQMQSERLTIMKDSLTNALQKKFPKREGNERIKTMY